MKGLQKNNSLHPLVHRLFFVGMFVICAASTVFYVNTTGALTSATTTTTSTAMPVTYSSTKSNVSDSTSSTIQAAAVPTATVAGTIETTGTATGTVTNITPEATISRTGEVSTSVPVTSATSPTTTSTINTGATYNEPKIQAGNTINTASGTNTQSVVSSSDSYKGEIKTRIEVTPISPSVKPLTITETSPVDDRVKTAIDAAPIATPNEPYEVENKTIVIAQPVIIAANDLPKEKNPKISGKIDNEIKIENVTFAKKDDGKGSLNLSGKAKPNSIITIYIFSNDPVVITVKTDESGNWSYQLDKEVADGQHEAFVAITDASGNVVSKSEPIAFIKTAQAATQIPLSELSNQSPMQRASQQYVLMALVIMVVCLLVALAMIGFITYKRNPNEGNY